MILTLISEPFIIQFNLLEIVKLGNEKSLYKFSLDFRHYENQEIQFSLPNNYQTHLNNTDLKRLIVFLMDKITVLIGQNEGQEVEFSFAGNSFVNAEYDIEIRVDIGEYYPNENDGALNLMFFFNLNVAYNYEGTSMVGLQARIALSEIQGFIGNLEKLVRP